MLKMTNRSSTFLLFIWSCLVLPILGGLTTNTVEPIENLEKAPKCCPGDLSISECRQTSLLKCPEGKYLLDPSIEPTDEFHITDDGDLKMAAADILIRREIFCIGKYAPEQSVATHYVAQVCFANDQDQKASMFTLKGTLALVSVFFLCITVYVYNVIVMRDTQDRVVRIALHCLLFFFLALGAIQLFSDVVVTVQALCTVLGFSMHFLIISYFSWINCVMANMWKSVVVPRWSIDEHKWYRWNHIYAWSVPIAIELVMVIGHFTQHDVLNPRIGINACWFEKDAMSLYYMYVPIAIMLLINVVLFVWTCFVLQRYGADIHPERSTALKYRVMMYLKLFLLVGLTWIFEILSYVSKNHFIWVIFDVINALHGLCLFLILVLFRPRVKRELAGKKLLCCLHAPEHWKDHHDMEHHRLNDDEGTMNFQTTVY